MSPPDTILIALQDPIFGNDLPPLSQEAKHLLNMGADDKENPRVLSLIAQKDPVYSGRVLSRANSAAYAHFGLTSSMDTAVRRLGVDTTYSILVASAMAFSFETCPAAGFCRSYLLNYTLSLTLTARKLSDWLHLPDELKAQLWLSSLLHCMGLFAGLVYGGATRELFSVALAELIPAKSLDLRSRPELEGFLFLSAKVADCWNMDPRIGATLRGAAQPSSTARDVKLLQATESLLLLKSQHKNEAPVLAGLFEEGIITREMLGGPIVSMAVMFP